MADYADAIKTAKAQRAVLGRVDRGVERIMESQAFQTQFTSDSVPRASSRKGDRLDAGNPEEGFVVRTAQTLEQLKELTQYKSDDPSVVNVMRPRKGHGY